MKRIFKISALIFCFTALILAVLPISNLAIFPAALALILSGFAYYLSKKTGDVDKIISFTLLLTVCALSITMYKAFFVETTVAETTILEEKEIQFEEEAIEELENLELDEIENTHINPSEVEELRIDDSELEDIQFEDVN